MCRPPKPNLQSHLSLQSTHNLYAQDRDGNPRLTHDDILAQANRPGHPLLRDSDRQWLRNELSPTIEITDTRAQPEAG